MKSFNMKIPRKLLILTILVSSLPSFAQDAGTNAMTPFQQAMSDYQQYFMDWKNTPSQAAAEKTEAAREKIIKMAMAMDQAPPVPEAARKHFVAGATLFKEAKNAKDYLETEAEFSDACRLAPWWPEARYNLAMVYVFAADYDSSIQDFDSAVNFYRDALYTLKIYQSYKLSDADARTVQDKIYELEAKQQKVAGAKAEQQKATAEVERKKREYQEKIGFLAGEWNFATTVHCNCTLDGQTPWHGVDVITITDKTILITSKGESRPILKGMIQGDDFASIKWVVPGAAYANDPNFPEIPDFPVKVTLDRNGSRFAFERPSRRLGTGWNTGMLHSDELTR